MKILLTTAFAASLFTAGAQSANRGFAITGNGNKDFVWMNIRRVDLGTGQITGTVFDYTRTKYTMNAPDASRQNANDQLPTSGFVAAAAYDQRSQKLFFTPMRNGQLCWLDADTRGETVAFHSTGIPGYVANTGADEANNITRMVIGADNYGYAVTNDGNHLYRFTTGKKPVVTDLGALVDADENGGLSVHNKCSSWGGDMIADAYGKLYIIAATRNVFVVDVNSRVATFKGTITGLPGNYSTNGAAVDADGKVILTSAIAFDGYYKMSITDLAAKKIEGSDNVYNASDLASSNLLFQKEADEARRYTVDNKGTNPTVATQPTMVYPNPVTGSSFNLLLDRSMNGNYTVILTDLAGRAIQTNKAGIVKGQESYRVNLSGVRPSKGTYLVKVLDEKNNVVMSDKVFIL